MRQGENNMLFFKLMFIVFAVIAIADFGGYSYQYYILQSTEGYMWKFLVFVLSVALSYMAFVVLRADRRKENKKLKNNTETQ